MNKREEKMEALNYFAESTGMSLQYALAETLFNYFEAAGFDRDIIAEELIAKSDEELLELYLNT